jgi:hypothetical protein
MKKTIGMMAALGTSLLSAQALAAPRPDLATSVALPSGFHVYQSAQTTVTVSNVGQKDAAGVSLTIQLPETSTSPSVHIMGTLGVYSPSCTRAGTRLVCSLGTIVKGTARSVVYDIALPFSTEPLLVTASATTTTAETNLGNNSATADASPLTYDTPVNAPLAMTNSHCTGQQLTSFFECALYPSSITSFDSVLNPDQTVSIVDAPPDTYGIWALVEPDHLQVDYYDPSGGIGSLDAWGTGGGCFEGPMVFPDSDYVAIYEVCPQ